MDQQEYLDKWQLKRAGYLMEGFVPANEASLDDDRVLITTEDLRQGGLDSRVVEAAINNYILKD